MKNVTTIVRGALAHHAGLDPRSVRPWHHLDSDLDVGPLELALISVDIEDAFGVELHPEGLAPLETVNDLFALVTRMVDEERRHQALDKVA